MQFEASQPCQAEFITTAPRLKVKIFYMQQWASSIDTYFCELTLASKRQWAFFSLCIFCARPRQEKGKKLMADHLPTILAQQQSCSLPLTSKDDKSQAAKMVNSSPKTTQHFYEAPKMNQDYFFALAHYFNSESSQVNFIRYFNLVNVTKVTSLVKT